MGVLPPNVNYCTVKGKFISFTADSADGDRFPDSVPMVGVSVKFTPSVAVVTNETSTPPVTILTSEISCVTDPQGVLLGPDGLPDVLLVASDDPDLKPHDWTWKVTVSSPTMRTITFDFIAPADGTVDLATVVPVPSSPGSEVSAWQTAVVATINARDEVLAARDEVLEAIEDFDPGTGGGGGGLGEEAVRDLIGATLVGGSGIDIDVNDLANTVTITAEGVDSSTVKTIIGTTLQSGVGVTVDVAGDGTVTINRDAVSKADVGLGSVDNTSDVNKPVSTAQAAALALKADLVGGVIPTAQLPAIAVTEFLGSVASQAAMLLLTGQKGDWCVRTDTGTTWVVTGSNPAVIGGWTQIVAPSGGGAVSSVNSKTGVVVLSAADVNAHPSTWMPAIEDVTGLATTLATLATLESPALTGSPTAPTPSAGDSSTKLATTAFVQAAQGTYVWMYDYVNGVMPTPPASAPAGVRLVEVIAPTPPTFASWMGVGAGKVFTRLYIAEG